MLRILTDLSTNQQVVNNPGTSYPKEGSKQMKTPNQPVNENTPYQHIPEQRQEVQNLIGEFQHPPEVIEQEPSTSNNSKHTMENHNQDPILNQQWNDPPHLQPPMRPMNIPAAQATNNVINTRNANTTAGANVENPATHRRVEMSMVGSQGRQSNQGGPTSTVTQSNVTPPTMNRRVEQNSCTHCSCHHQLTEGARDVNVPGTENQRLNVHTEYEDRTNGASRFFCGKRHTDESGLRECQIIRILPDESDDYMDIVRDSVSAQTRRGSEADVCKQLLCGRQQLEDSTERQYRLDTTLRRVEKSIVHRGADSCFFSGRRRQGLKLSTNGPRKSEVHG